MPRSIWIINWKRYNPPSKALNKAARSGEPLPWSRLERDWYRDIDIATMPDSVRWVWPALMGLACYSRPPGRVDMTDTELALELRMTEEGVKVAIDHLRRRRKVRFSRPKEMADATPEGGEKVA